MEPRWTLWLLLGLLVLALWLGWLLHPLGSGAKRIISDPDAYLHAWNLWWVQHAIVELGQSPYHTSYNGYPEVIPLTYHQLILPLGLASIPLFGLGLQAGQVLTVWQYALGGLGFLGMFQLVRRQGGPPAGAALAGLYYVFSPLYWQNLVRPDSLSYVLFPWVVLSVLWSMRGRARRLTAPVLLVAVLILLSPYFALGLAVLWGLALVFAERLPVHRPRLALVLPLALALTAFQWMPQGLGTHPNPVRWRIVEMHSADLSYWLLPPESLWWLPRGSAWWMDLWSIEYSTLYPGWFALGLVVFSLGNIPPARRRWVLITVGVFFLLACGPGLHVLGTTYFSGWLPYGWGMMVSDTVRAFRAPLRFGFFVIFFLALGVGVLYPDSRRWAPVLFLLVLLELVRPPLTATPLPDHDALDRVGTHVEEPALVPVPATYWGSEVQYGQTVHEKKLALVGISYGVPQLWNRLARNPVLEALYHRESLPVEGWEELRREGFGGVILHGSIFPPRLRDLRDRWKRQLERWFGPPVLVSDRFELYRIDPSETPPAPRDGP